MDTIEADLNLSITLRLCHLSHMAEDPLTGDWTLEISSFFAMPSVFQLSADTPL
jgi:hypothetical protein